MNLSKSTGAPLRIRNRRSLLGLGAAAGIAGLLPTRPPARAAEPALRFGTTPVLLDDRIALLERWQKFLGARPGRPVVFVQRRSYAEIVDLLLQDGVEAAWLCGHPFVIHQQRLALVAVPRHEGAPLYRSYLIVPAADRSTRAVSGLRGRVFAYSDPLSNSGFLVPRAELVAAGADPARFFRRSFFTFSHRKVVDAVRLGLADAGAVDGYVYDTLAAQHPAATAGVQVAWRSAPHGFPPVVARTNWPEAERSALARALRSMDQAAQGRAVLAKLNIDGFEAGAQALFDSIRALLSMPGVRVP